MLEAILLFGPGALAFAYYARLRGLPPTRFEILTLGLPLVLALNFLGAAFLYARGYASRPFLPSPMTSGFFLKYGGVELLGAFLLPHALRLGAALSEWLRSRRKAPSDGSR
jgi:hypothetical protein